MNLEFRKARLDDVPGLIALIDVSARTLSAGDYTAEQINAALGTVWGVDEELIRDQTYFIVIAKNGDFAGSFQKQVL